VVVVAVVVGGEKREGANNFKNLERKKKEF
jgi:hypothetical protein